MYQKEPKIVARIHVCHGERALPSWFKMLLDGGSTIHLLPCKAQESLPCLHGSSDPQRVVTHEQQPGAHVDRGT